MIAPMAPAANEPAWTASASPHARPTRPKAAIPKMGKSSSSSRNPKRRSRVLPKGRKSISARFPCRSVSWEIFESAHDMRVDGLSGGVTIDEAFASVRPAVTGCWRFFVNVFASADPLMQAYLPALFGIGVTAISSSSPWGFEKMRIG